MVVEVVENQLWGIIFFLIALLIGMALVSVHYRKKYETTKKRIVELLKRVKNINKRLELLEKN